MSAPPTEPLPSNPVGDGHSEIEDVPMISASHLSSKFRALADYSPESLTSEIKRLASLPYHALKRELEPRDHIQKLPVELLAEIFTILQSFELEEEAVPVSHLLAGAVSQKWRTIALGTPSLWRWITVDDTEPWTRTRTYLERAAQCPLDIKILWAEEEEASEESLRTVEDLNNVMELLIPHVHHWHTFSFEASQYTLIYHTLARLEHLSAPGLEELSLSHQDEAEVGTAFEPVELSHSFKLFSGGDEISKSLKKARLWGVHLDWETDLFSHLTSLTLAYHPDDVRPTVEQFFAMFTSSAPTLEEFTLEYSGPKAAEGDDAVEGWPTEPISFPVLRYLRLAFLSAAYVQNILMITDAPEVKELSLDLDEADEESTMAEWARVVEVICTSGFEQPSAPGITTRKRGTPLFPVLRTLKLLAYPGDIIDLGILLYYHPGLTSLTINFHWIPPTFIDFLSMPIRSFSQEIYFELPRWVSQHLKDSLAASEELEAEPWLLPKLEVFKAYKQSGSSFRYLVDQRKSAGIPLREIHYSDGSVMNLRDRMWLAENLDKLEEFEESDDGGSEESEEEEEEEEEEEDEEDEEDEDEDDDSDSDEP